MKPKTNPAGRLSILVVDDEAIVRESLGAWFREDGYDVDTADGAREGLRLAAEKTYDIALIDIKMPGVDGLELQAKLKEAAPDLSVVIMTAYASVETAVKALKSGAHDYIVKPFDPEELSHLIRRVQEHRSLRSENLRLKKTLEESAGPSPIIGRSPAMRKVMDLVASVAPSDSTVLIHGESGTGKELVARAIHLQSPRRFNPLVAVHCGALAEGVLESELFGHEKGAFTGAAERRLGRFELADTGTIFLDEIGEISQAIQVKLLRVLETRNFFRVGGTQPIKVDVRVVAATNRNLKEAVGVGDFREDLFYRLNVLTVYLPPLRERREDIPHLVRRFIREFSTQHDRTFKGITHEAMQRLVAAPWPGNVRQLRNLIESMVVLAPGTEIRASDIPADIFEGAPMLLPVLAHPAQGREADSQQLGFILRSLMELRLQVEQLRRRVDEGTTPVQVIEVPPPLTHPIFPDTAEEPVLYRPGMTMAEVEKAAIEAALSEHKGNRRLAADALGIGERTLYRKIKEYHLG